MQFQPFIVGQEIGLGPDSGPIGNASSIPPFSPLLNGISAASVKAHIGWTSGEFDWPFTPPTFKIVNVNDTLLLVFGYEGAVQPITVTDDAGNIYTTIGSESGSSLPSSISIIMGQLSNGVPTVLHITPAGSFSSPNYFVGQAICLFGPSPYSLSSIINSKEIASGDIVSDDIDSSATQNVAVCCIIGGSTTTQPPEVILDTPTPPSGIFSGSLSAGLANETTSSGDQINSRMYVNEVDATIVSGNLTLPGSYFGFSPPGSAPVECLCVIFSVSH